VRFLVRRFSGHSHILKVMFDKKHNLLHMERQEKWFSPSAYDVRFVIDGDKIKDMEIIEMEKDVLLLIIDWYIKNNSCSKLIWELILKVPLML
jgi:hypothetical protein